MREINNDMNIRSAEELESMIETESGEISFYLRKKNAGCDSSGEEKACVYESIKNELSGYSQQIRINKLNNLEGIMIQYAPSENPEQEVKAELCSVIKKYFNELEVQRMGKFRALKSIGEQGFKIL